MNVAERTRVSATEAAQSWLAQFAAALQVQDAAAAAELFLADGLWRDVLAFTWTIQTMAGRPAIEAKLRETLARTQPKTFRIPGKRTPPRWVSRAGTECIEAIFEFETAFGPAHGVLRLVPSAESPGRLRAWTLITNLQELRGHEEAFKKHTPTATDSTRDFGAENWLDRLSKARAYADRDPTVIIVGGGQAGLSLAARLHQLGVDTLIVDRHARIGDNWRKRYHSLTLHNEVHVNHLPYLPFPPTFPTFIPKDRLANWFESYVESMELNFWTGTELVGGSYDERRRQWNVTLRRSDGSARIMHPRHLVFATGVSSIPFTPALSGLDAYRGTAVHSGDFKNAEEWKDRKALVLGSGTSGHDVAQELHAHGAEVTIIQRSPTYVVSLKEAQSVYAIYSEGIPFDDCDLLATSFPYPVLRRSYQISTAQGRAVDRALLDGLAARGFRLFFGEDETGFQMMYLRRGGGYYFNVGCSDLIISGAIGLLQYADIESFVAQGARLRDGRVVPADLLVLATGYKNQQDTVRAYLGDEIADKIGPVWGFDQGGELRNMWRRTAQPGLWFTAGSLAQCRIYSRTLALQIKALEEGLLN
ncbi:MAG: NAD(P)/FAD-dependent oxidoreductase [Rhizobiales bacterium]|nr:NAD(P)/FAD-dependent oxidoreductase [Hyphomicrobiales bacterium]